MKPPPQLHGALALVTGGGTGVGRAVCLRLAERGAAAVAVNYSRSEEEAQVTVREIERLGCRAIAIRADVGDDQAVDQMAREVVATFGGVSVLVNSAGTTRRIPLGDLDSISPEDWQRTLNVNLLGAFRCTRALRSALAHDNGAVVNIASIAGHRGVGSSLAYGTGKGALLQMTRMLALALAPEIRVNSVSPATLDSRWLRDLMGDGAAEVFFEREAKAIPMGRILEPEDVADAVLALLLSPMVTGQDLIVDGGKHLAY